MVYHTLVTSNAVASGHALTDPTVSETCFQQVEDVWIVRCIALGYYDDEK